MEILKAYTIWIKIDFSDSVEVFESDNDKFIFFLRKLLLYRTL